MNSKEYIDTVLEFCDNFEIENINDYKQLICYFQMFSDEMSSFSVEDQNLLLNAFNNTFFKIQNDLCCDRRVMLPIETIDDNEDLTYFCYKLNKNFNDLNELTKTFVSLRLLLPENTLFYPNLEMDDFFKNNPHIERRHARENRGRR